MCQAAERKADKVRAPFREATEDANAKFQAAQDYINEIKAKGGVAHGAIWWMGISLASSDLPLFSIYLYLFFLFRS